MEEENQEQIPFPEKIIKWTDIAKGIGWAALDFITHRHAHEGLSEHFITDAVDHEQL